jgi:DNA-binding NarL/FixJ family response regulator
MSAKRGRPRHPDLLTPAEWRVVDAVRHGMGTRQIARRRGVSPDAVKFHVANALHGAGAAVGYLTPSHRSIGPIAK